MSYLKTPTREEIAALENKPTRVDTLSGAARLFFSHISPWMIGAVALAAWAAKVWLGGWSWWDLAFGAAILLFWPVQEWLIHVFILHFKPTQMLGQKVDMHVSEMHRVHHQIPWVIEYVFVPTRTVLQVLLLGIPLFLLIWSSFLPIEIGITGVALFATFGLVYEWTHFLIHTNYRPKSFLYRRLWENHRWHHFKNENYWFGVSRLEGDRLLRTSPDPSEVESSPTCRTLGIAGHDEKGDAA